MNTTLPAALATELDALAGPDQLQRVAELLRATLAAYLDGAIKLRAKTVRAYCACLESVARYAQH